MTITLLVSPSASGKTQYCIERARQLLAERKLQPAWVLVPDRLQTSAVRRRLASSGGAIGIHVGTFGDLYQMLLLRVRQSPPVSSEPMVYRLIESAVKDLVGKGELAYYGSVAHMPGFIHAIRSRVAELKQARVFPEAFLEQAKKHGSALGEIAKAYAAYQVRLQAAGWVDPEGLNWLAVEALERNPGLVGDIRLVIVDGFDSFNGAQLAAIRLLGKAVPEVMVTLPGSPDMRRGGYRRFARSLADLQTAVPTAVVQDLPRQPALPDPLKHIEMRLFQSEALPQAADGCIFFIEARTPVDEAREALRWIKARILRDGLRPDECALITPDPERYRPYLREAGAEFGMPLRFTHGDALASTPGIAALLDLLELHGQNWSRPMALEAVRSPYFDLSRFGLTPQDAEPLELVGLTGPVIAGLDQWQDSLALLARLDEIPPGEEGERPQGPSLPVGGQAESLWRSLQAVSGRLAPPEPQPTRAWVRWVEDLLEELSFFERQETELDQASALGLRETFRALVLGERVAGETDVEYKDFLGELRSTLEGNYTQDLPLFGQPAVLVLRVLEARGLRFRAVAVLGLSEGVFPEVEREDPFMSEKVRADLGLEPRLEREQAGLFYQAVTRADQFLLLMRPTLADDGERWEPSPYWNAATSLFTGPPVLIRTDDPRPLADGASSEEVLFSAVRRGSLAISFGELLPRFEQLRHARDVLQARLARAAAGPFEGDLSTAQDALESAFGPEHVWSPSQLESYGTCPFLFFAAQAMKLEPREPPQVGLDPLQLGNMLHAILEKAYREAEDRGDLESVLTSLRAVARTEFAAAPQRYGFRPSAIWDVEQAYLLDRLIETVRGLAALGGGWVPTALERSFGRDENPPLELSIDGRPVLLRGVIDRVDTNQNGQVRVLDYKTGSSHLAPQDLIDGQRLQLPLYALAARDALELGEPVEGLYWAILAGRAGSLRLSRFNREAEDATYRGPAGAAQVALQHVGRILAGVRGGSFPPQPPHGGCPSYCPAAAWCWRFAPSMW